MSIVERVESLAAAWAKHDTPEAKDPMAADLRALLALVRACEAIKVFVDAGKAGLPKYREEEDALQCSYQSALAAVTREE
jgi:hypothetical protein